MNLDDLKYRLEYAKKEAGGIPQNFWWALLQVALELHINVESYALEKLKRILKGHRVPAAVYKLLYDGYYHPACTEDLKIRAQFELQRTRLAATVQKMNEEIYRMADLKCRYTVWEIAHHITNSDKIRYSDDSKLKTFLRAFNSPPPNEGVFDELRYGLRTDDRPDLSRQAYWFCYLCDNRLPEHKRSAAAELFRSKQAEFVREAILNDCFPAAVYDQCLKIRYALVDYNERLAEKWCNMVQFAAKIEHDAWYYYATLDEGNQPGMAIWRTTKEDKYRFERGLCFLTDLDAKRWSEGML